MNIVSAWTRQVESGQQPSSVDLRDHLATVHDENAGFTEAFNRAKEAAAAKA